MTTYTVSPHPRGEFEPRPRWVRVYFNSQLIADSRNMMLLRENNRLPLYYFPKHDARMDLLEPSDSVTRCPYKGEANFHSIRIGGELRRDLAWTYRYPMLECLKIQGLLGFLNEKVDLYEGDELLPRPETPWS